jgi:hypothetical protein
MENVGLASAPLKSPVESRVWVRALAWCLAGLLFPGIVLGVGIVRYGSLDGVYAFVRGARVYADPPVVYLKNVQPGSVHDVQFTLGNHGSVDSSIVKVIASCHCLELLSHSKVIPGGGRLELPARLTTDPKNEGRSVVTVRCFLDDQEDIVTLSLDVEFAK